MPEIFNPVDDLIAEQALVDALVADFTEDDWNRMASYCHLDVQDVICHIAFFDYCAVELLAGRGESVNAVADAASEQDEHYHVMAFRDRSGADILNWWREQRTLMTASFLELGESACRGRQASRTCPCGRSRRRASWSCGRTAWTSTMRSASTLW
ncbi:MAG: maleylpyruvate isomerase N-terminal domain-containing protein [Eggerthella lenta]